MPKKQIGKVPENLRRQNDQLNMQLKDFRDRTEKTVAKLKNTEAAHRVQAQQIRELTEEYSKSVAQVERLRQQTEAKSRAAEELRVAVERERQERENHLADQTHLNLEHSAANQARIAAGDELARRAAEKDKALKALKRAQVALEQSEALLPGLRNTLENLSKDKAVHAANVAKLVKDTEAVRVDIEARADASEMISRSAACPGVPARLWRGLWRGPAGNGRRCKTCLLSARPRVRPPLPPQMAMDKFLKEETASKEGATVLIAARKAVATSEEELVSCKIHERRASPRLPRPPAPPGAASLPRQGAEHPLS